MAGGTDAKWGDSLGVRRHMAPVDGEPLLHRTVRQLRERGSDDVYIVGPDLPGYDVATRLEPETRSWGQEALNAQSHWSNDGRTVLIYGDTVFTDSAMDIVAGFDRRTWQLFGRFGSSDIKRYGEIFAISWWPEHSVAWRSSLNEAFSLCKRGIIGRAGCWEAFRIMGGARGRSVSRHRRYPQLMTEILDGTDDFDDLPEYRALIRSLDVTEQLSVSSS